MVISTFVSFGWWKASVSRAKGCSAAPKEHEDPPHTPGGDVELEVPEGIGSILGHPVVSQYPVVQYRESPVVLVGDHSGQIRLRTTVNSRLMFSTRYEASAAAPAAPVPGSHGCSR